MDGRRIYGVRPTTFVEEDAGFGTLEVLPVENDFFRFYRLRA